MKPDERDRRARQQLADLSRRGVDLSAAKGVAREVEEKALVEAERQLYMRCGGCGERIGVGLVFSRFEVVAGEDGRPVVNRLKMGACNGATGCDFATKCREGADLVEMVEYVWLTGDAPVAGGELADDVRSAEGQVRPSTVTPQDPLSGGPDTG